VTWFRAVGWGLLFCSLAIAADRNKGAEIAQALRHVSLDPEQTFHVRELELARGDIKIYLTEGVLSFLTPVAGHCIGAVFTTSGVEAGDAEVLVLPPQRSERASLASFIQSPNLDEHFGSALFLFSDNTAAEVLAQIQNRPVRKESDIARNLAPSLNPVVEAAASELDVRLVQALLDNHKPAGGVFYGMMIGRQLGAFDVLYTPSNFEPVSVGRLVTQVNGLQNFQLWTSFRTRHAPPFVPPEPRTADYRIEANIHPDLSMSVTATFTDVAGPDDGCVLSFDLSDRLKVLSAEVDGKPVEVFEHETARSQEAKSAGSFLLISDTPFLPGSRHTVQVRYEGSVIWETPVHTYFVDERNTWYPVNGPVQANFDLTFHCPERLDLVSTGELLSDRTENGTRTVHRKTTVPEHLAGFNLGEYTLTSQQRNGYEIECYFNKGGAATSDSNIPEETAAVLDDYTSRWGRVPIRTMAISPIPGYFGQGFPGLIYLSDVSYLREQDRPAELRNARLDAFFSDLLLPHEVAHQWWGNVVTPASYRANWLLEAMANDAALQDLKRRKGTEALNEVLARYRDDLLRERNGKRVESAGPVDFGQRLIPAADASTWHTILYEKGTWILEMLGARLGDDNFRNMQLRLLDEFATKPVTNEDFRRIASGFLPQDQPDHNLELFFDTWIYGTGIPKLSLQRSGQTFDLELSGVDPDFTGDVPLVCTGPSGKQQTRWIRASTGSNVADSRHHEPVACELPPPDSFLYAQ
jgi:hypothetical protein